MEQLDTVTDIEVYDNEVEEPAVTPVSDSSVSDVEETDESREELAVTSVDDSSEYVLDSSFVEDVERELNAGEEVVPIAIDTLVELIRLHNQKEESTDSQLVENVSELNSRVTEVETISLVAFASAFCVIGVVIAVKFSRWFFRFF